MCVVRSNALLRTYTPSNTTYIRITFRCHERFWGLFQ